MDKNYYESIQNNDFLKFLECYKSCGNYIRVKKNNKKIKYPVIYTILKYQNIEMLHYILSRAYHPKKGSLREMYPHQLNSIAHNIYSRGCYTSSVFLLKTKRGYYYAKKYLIGVDVDRECLTSTSKKCLDIFWGLYTPLRPFYEKNDVLKEYRLK
jgi:hypothetical protein